MFKDNETIPCMFSKRPIQHLVDASDRALYLGKLLNMEVLTVLSLDSWFIYFAFD